MDARLAALTRGSYALRRDAHVEYVLPPAQSAPPPQRIDGPALRKCLRGRRVVFMGDSRMRYLWSAFNHLVGGDTDPACPHYRACEVNGSVVLKFDHRCARYYIGGTDWAEKCNTGNVTVAFDKGVWAGDLSAERLHALGNADAVLVNTGAWSVRCGNRWAIWNHRWPNSRTCSK